jgi:hypothetical protein
MTVDEDRWGKIEENLVRDKENQQNVDYTLKVMQGLTALPR